MRTHLVHGNHDRKRWDFDHHVVPPISASAAYRLGSVHRGVQGFVEFASEEAEMRGHTPIYIYDRLDEPTRSMLEENLAYAEGGETAVSFASGMAAISAALGVTTRAGDEIVAHHTLYGCTYSLFTQWLPRCGISVRFADLRDEQSFKEAVTSRTRVVYFETPVNPTLHLIDIAEVRRWMDEVKAEREGKDRLLMIVDNSFATPYCQRPLELGADLVAQSLTKDIGGFGTDMGRRSDRSAKLSRAALDVPQGFWRRALAQERLAHTRLRATTLATLRANLSEDHCLSNTQVFS